ncbi:methylthiotransferase YqeV [Thermacetogenium phaeum DSM 12270]|uniref:Threonylcarbamoyladenosine tRNA methylthiotransferase MtaB n=1 Tax=Thermacetogenium phaeum (strain ATCC BAA-254 / DSM 26808 / PB) TaxID=1089553 RepID=K4LJV1_THEPS|nr:methylthiotransferase YqeV [Thermacetogenium phaeum DSM 12270]
MSFTNGVIWVVEQQGKRVAFYTLGCKVNQQETASLMKLFRKRGFRVVDFKKDADVYIINTCAVTHTAAQKCRQVIRRAIGRSPAAVVAVLGCYSQVAAEEVLSIPGVDLVVGTSGRSRLVELVSEAMEKKRSGEWPAKGINAVEALDGSLDFEQLPLPDDPRRTRAFLKIEDGCDQFCTYCTVPYARGGVRSLHPDLVQERLSELVCAGYREVVLTGVHTSAYGKDLGGGVNLPRLLRELVELPGNFRIRLSSVEPAEVTEELLELLATSPRLCRHLHIPLQSGDDEILCRMNRPYTAEEYRKLFHLAREMIPGIAITTDVLVGFPGEEERHFQNTFNLIATLPFRDLHVFKYSPRPGTPAAAMPEQVAPPVKDRRSSCLRRLADELAASFARRFVGETMTVLVERRSRKRQGWWEGLTDNYLRVFFPASQRKSGVRGEFVPVRILEVGPRDELQGEAVEN